MQDDIRTKMLKKMEKISYEIDDWIRKAYESLAWPYYSDGWQRLVRKVSEMYVEVGSEQARESIHIPEGLDWFHVQIKKLDNFLQKFTNPKISE